MKTFLITIAVIALILLLLPGVWFWGSIISDAIDDFKVKLEKREEEK